MSRPKKSVEHVSARIDQKTLDIITTYMDTYGASKSEAIIALIHKGGGEVDTMAPEPSILASIDDNKCGGEKHRQYLTRVAKELGITNLQVLLRAVALTRALDELR